MKLKPGFQIVDFVDEHILVPVGAEADNFNGVITLSEAASFLLQKMMQSVTKKELLVLLMQEYDVDEETAKSDLEKMIADLLEMGIIED